MDRDALRGKFFSSRNRRSKLVTFQWDGEAVTVEVRQPTVAKRTKILERGMKKDLVDAEEAKWLAILECAFAPGDDKALFDARDRDNVLAQPDAFDALSTAAIQILHPESEAAAHAEAEGAEKN